jgi:acetyl esterase/lipase
MSILRNFIAALVAIGSCVESSFSEDAPYVQHVNIVYGEVHGIGLLMDVFAPKGDGNGLGVVDVISGAWHSDRGKINDHQRAQTFDVLCRKGYTVFAIRPGSVTKFSVPEMLDHLNRGIRWVKGHANDYKIDPDRLGLMGASAGGHLACLAGVTAGSTTKSNSPADNNSTRVKAVAVFFPPTDFLDYGGKVADARADDHLGKLARALAFPDGVDNLSEAEVTRGLTEISPARRVTRESPPFLFIHGDSDPDVPLQQSERMVSALKQMGVSAELIVKHGGGHPWPTIHEEVAVLANWFDQQLAAK